jgi:hypothetical protein
MDVACRPAVSIDGRRNHNRGDVRAIRCLVVGRTMRLMLAVQAATTDQVMKDETD